MYAKGGSKYKGPVALPPSTAMNPTLQRVAMALAFVGAVIATGGLALFVLGHGRWTLGQCFYMSVISVSTVGFSELPDIEHVRGARGVVVATILLGLGSVAYFQSAMTALIVEGVFGHAFRKNRMKNAIEKMKGHVVVAGLGGTGKHVAEELVATGTPFVAIDKSHEHLERVSLELMAGKMLYVHGDATEDHTLLEAGVDRANGVIAALTHDRDNLFVTLSARGLNAAARIVTKVVETEAVPKMARAGANATVSPNIIGGRRLASELVRPEVVEFLDQMLRDKERTLRLEEVMVPEDSPFVGQALKDVPIRKSTNALVVAVRDRSRRFFYNPGPDHTIEGGTVLVVLGESGDMTALRALMGSEAPLSLRGGGRRA